MTAVTSSEWAVMSFAGFSSAVSGSHLFFPLLKLTTVRRIDSNNIFLGCPSHFSHMWTVNTHQFKRTLNQNTLTVLTRENIPLSANLSHRMKRNVMNLLLEVSFFSFLLFCLARMNISTTAVAEVPRQPVKVGCLMSRNPRCRNCF